jgi:uncharacterized membrane protein (UPF0127 family)
MSAPATEQSVGRKLVRERDGAVIARIELAKTTATRLLGLMGRRSFPTGFTLWIEPCNSIHMMFVRFPIDVVWLDAGGAVKKVSRRVRPWIGLAGCWGAKVALELEAGAAERADVRVGDKLVAKEELA